MKEKIKKFYEENKEAIKENGSKVLKVAGVGLLMTGAYLAGRRNSLEMTRIYLQAVKDKLPETKVTDLFDSTKLKEINDQLLKAYE
jgi:hypothetical protein